MTGKYQLINPCHALHQDAQHPLRDRISNRQNHSIRGLVRGMLDNCKEGKLLSGDINFAPPGHLLKDPL